MAYVHALLSSEHFKQSELARRLNVSDGRVSQILNNPGNLTLKQIVKISRALGRKVAIVGYDDGDARNEQGPIIADVFMKCWELTGRPRDLLDVQEIAFESKRTLTIRKEIRSDRRPAQRHRCLQRVVA